MLDLSTVIEWSHAVREQSARVRAESKRLQADYKWIAFQFQHVSKSKLASLPGTKGSCGKIAQDRLNGMVKGVACDAFDQ